jgi:hypothetical protein
VCFSLPLVSFSNLVGRDFASALQKVHWRVSSSLTNGTFHSVVDLPDNFAKETAVGQMFVGHGKNMGRVGKKKVEEEGK